MATTVYPGQPLWENQIRLIRLLPGDWTNPVQCTLFNASLADAKYHALSYVWGSQRVTRPIHVNGQVCKATVSLESALRHLRERYTDGLVLWVDALCINQRDIDERAKQVQLMGHIYQSCQEVIVYLGDRLERSTQSRQAPAVIRFDQKDPPHRNGLDPSGHSTRQRRIDVFKAFDFLRELSCDRHLVNVAALGCPREDDDDEEEEGEKGEKEEPNLTPENDREDLLETLRQLMNPPTTPFWNRIWVVQELVFAPQITIVHGTISAPWTMFAKAASSYLDHSLTCCLTTIAQLPQDQIKVLTDCSRRILDIEELRSGPCLFRRGKATYDVEKKERSLLELLRKFRDRRASDPRDKVYALLNLVNFSQERPRIKPDYALSEAAVYRKATLEAIYGSKSLCVFSTELGRKFRNDLPSWVPDWGTPGGYTYSIRAEAVELYNACPWISATMSIVGEGLPGELLVQGLAIGRVTFTGMTMWGDVASVSRDTLGQWLKMLHGIKTVGPLGSMGCEREANRAWNFWKLICADIICGQFAGSKVRRALFDDELTFVVWAQRSERSPFHKDFEWDSDDMWSDAARAWRNVLLLWPDKAVLDSYFHVSPGFDRHYIPHGLDFDLQERARRVKDLLQFVHTSALSEAQLLHGTGEIRQDAPWREFLVCIRDRILQRYGDVELNLHSREDVASTMDNSIMAATLSRRLIVTSNGYVGLGPAATMVGDEVFLLRGGKTPFVLRGGKDSTKTSTGLNYEIMGDCYMQELMDGDRSVAGSKGWKEISLL